MMAQRRQMDQAQAATVIQASMRGRMARLESAEKVQRAEQALAANDLASAQKIMKEISDDAAEAVRAAEASHIGGSKYAEPDRERLCCDILNTAVMAALIGGFALTNMTISGTTTLEMVVYTMSCFAVHACTCSALTSALLYRTAVRLEDEAVPKWAADHKFLLSLPLQKFGMGCVAYLGSVIVVSFKDLSASQPFQLACLAIGIMSMSTVFVTVAVILWEDLPKRETKMTRVAPHAK